jgi:hypothetical protein
VISRVCLSRLVAARRIGRGDPDAVTPGLVQTLGCDLSGPSIPLGRHGMPQDALTAPGTCSHMAVWLRPPSRSRPRRPRSIQVCLPS